MHVRRKTRKHRSTRATAGEMFLVGMDRQGVVRISRAVDAPTLGRYLHEIADELIAGQPPERGAYAAHPWPWQQRSAKKGFLRTAPGHPEANQGPAQP
jgi:hypothetical protein